ncbi:MAG TPA: hypothetical protein V6D05_17755 [Stenomitos sp.]
MTKFLRIYGAIAAATLMVAGCAAHPPLTTLDGAAQTQTLRVERAGNVSVPLSLPALDAERGVQYAYNSNYINTVEVRLRDSLGNESVQYVVRNAYLNTSKAAGTVNVTFFNVLPGVFTLTVRTSHQRLLSATGPVKYDGLRDVFFLDQDADDAYDANETEVRVISGNRNSNFLVFAPASLNANDILPWSLRSDTSSTAAGLGIGGATQSIVPNSTTTVAVNVRQMPRWGNALWSTTREVTAGEAVSLPIADIANVQSNDQVALSDPSGFTLNGGIADVGSASLHVYGLAPDVPSATISFTPTRATNSSPNAPASGWNLWLGRGQGVSEIGYASNYANAPKLTVLPALADASNSRFYGSAAHVSTGGTAQVAYDLRDGYGNLVAGNVSGTNQVSLTSVKRANAGLTMDYAMVGYSYTTDPRNGLNPFILPGRTTGTISGSGVYLQGSTSPGPITTAATYSATTAGASDSDLRIKRLEVPYHIYAANLGSFGGGTHRYTLNFTPDPGSSSGGYWVSLRRAGGPVVASGSVTATQLNSSAVRDIALALPGAAPGTLPAPMIPITVNPVILTVPGRALDTSADDGTFFDVTDYGARRVSDTDTVRARVLNNKSQIFFGEVPFQWLQ